MKSGPPPAEQSCLRAPPLPGRWSRRCWCRDDPALFLPRQDCRRDSRRPRSSEQSFRAGEQASHAAIAPAGSAQCTGKCLEQRFDFVMAGATVEYAGMNASASPTGKAVEEIVHELRLQIAYQPGANLGIDRRGCPPTKVHRRETQGFVHGHHEIACAKNSPLGAQRFVEALAKHYANIFDGVMLIDGQVALGLKLKIEAAVMGKEFQHVIEETDSG